ncbi:hypothetical protein, partial [Kingella kingae]|uniref:hypothetical protein n=1 Tax=Kingella kingae TaxID=504 RepID=UPI001E3EFFD4
GVQISGEITLVPAKYRANIHAILRCLVPQIHAYPAFANAANWLGTIAEIGVPIVKLATYGRCEFIVMSRP